jgi:hypothetical protein
MFDSGIPGLPRLTALRGLGRFFGFTFFAICYLLGLPAFQANPRLDVGSRHGNRSRECVVADLAASRANAAGQDAVKTYSRLQGNGYSA